MALRSRPGRSTLSIPVKFNSLTGDLINHGTINVGDTTGAAALYPNPAASGGTINLSGGGTINLNSDSEIYGYNNATLVNLDNLIQGQGTIESLTSFQNEAQAPSTPTSRAGRSHDRALTTNSGTIEATSGGTLNASNASIVSGGTLDGGTWIVGSNSTLELNANISTLAATVILQGPGASFPDLATVTSITSAGQLEIEGGLVFSTSGSLSNSGTISLERGTLNVAGTYTETERYPEYRTGGLTPGTQFGQLSVTGSATPGGTLNINLIDGYTPSAGNSYQIIPFGSRTTGSDFATENGLTVPGGLVLTPVYNPTNLTLTVNQIPAFTSANSTTFTVGQTGSFTVTASGFPIPTLSESSSDTLPSGVTFNAATGVLSGTPAAGSGGVYTLNFTASNGVGSSPTQTFALTVNQAPAITSASSTTFTVGQAGSFTVTASGVPDSDADREQQRYAAERRNVQCDHRRAQLHPGGGERRHLHPELHRLQQRRQLTHPDFHPHCQPGAGTSPAPVARRSRWDRRAASQ